MGAAEDDAVEPEEAVFVDVLLLDDVFVSVFAAAFVSVPAADAAVFLPALQVLSFRSQEAVSASLHPDIQDARGSVKTGPSLLPGDWFFAAPSAPALSGSVQRLRRSALSAVSQQIADIPERGTPLSR